MSAHRPYRWTGMIARVRGVMAARRRPMIHRERVRLDVDEDRPGSDAGDRAGRREERERRGDHFVARTDAERHQRDEQRIGPRGDRRRRARPDDGRLPLAFQPFHLRSHNELLRIADARDRGQDLLAYRRVLEPEIEQGNLHVFVGVGPRRKHNLTIVLQGLVVHNARLDGTGPALAEKWNRSIRRSLEGGSSDLPRPLPSRGGAAASASWRGSARPGMGTSTHNSQVIHAGIYPSGSLKARHCVDGARLLYEFLAAHGVPHRRCGKLIVARDDTEIPALEALRARGIANGVQGLEVVDAAYVPCAQAGRPRRGRAHLAGTPGDSRSGSAGQDARAFSAQERGVFLLPGTKLAGAEQRDGSIEIATASERIDARSIVNAAGLYADQVSLALGGSPFRIYPCRGEYAELVPSKRPLVQRSRLPAAPYPQPRHALEQDDPWHRDARADHPISGRKDDYEDVPRLPVDAFLEPARRLLPLAATLGSPSWRQRHPPKAAWTRDGICRLSDWRDEACPRRAGRRHRIAWPDGIIGHRGAGGADR